MSQTTPEQVKEDLAVAVKDLGVKLGTYEERIANNAKIGDDLREEMKSVETRVKELHTTLVEMQKEAGRLDPNIRNEAVTIGQLLVSHDSYKSFKPGSGPQNESSNIPVEGGFNQYRKDLTTTTGGAGIVAHRDPRMVDVRFRPLTLRDVIPTFPIGSNAVDYVKETRFNQLMGQLTATAAAAQDTIAVDNVNGFYVGQSVTLAPGEADEETLIIKAAGITITDTDTSAGTIEFTANLANEQTADTLVVSDTFVFTPEAKLKPRADMEVELLTASVKTLAHYMAATRQILADEPGLRQHVDMRLMQGLGLAEETQLLYGDGTTQQLQGIMTDSDTQTYSWSSGLSGDSKLDAIRRAMTLSMLAHLPVDSVVVHPSDWEQIETVKGSDGHYIWQAVPGGGITPMVWRVPVIVTTAINSGDALVGSFNLGCTLWDREDSNIRLSESHKDFFQRNMVAILAEQRLAFTMNRPEAFVAIDFDSAPA